MPFVERWSAMLVLASSSVACGAPSTGSVRAEIGEPPRARSVAEAKATEPSEPIAPPQTPETACLGGERVEFSELMRMRSQKPRKPQAKHGWDPPPRPNPCETEPASRECRYHEARLHFEGMRFDLAARGFRVLALDPIADDIGRFAGTQELESLNLIGTRADRPRPACFDLLSADAAKMSEVHCAPGRKVDAEFCEVLTRIAVDVERLQIEGLIRLADAGPPNDSRMLYERAGDRYLELFERSCAPGAVRPYAPRCEEILYNAFKSFQAAGRPGQAEAARAKLLDPRNGLERTELAKKLEGSPR